VNFNEFIAALKERLNGALPGLPAQLKMSSMARIGELMKFVQSDDPIKSSVLILFYPYQDDIGLVLILRPTYPGVHSGQISLPGGKYEEEDDSLVYTALREAKEEIGINPLQVHVLGQLTDLYIPPSRYIVTPVLGFMTSRPEFKAEPNEVAKIIEIRISDFMNDHIIQRKKMKLALGISIKFPAYVLDGNVVWGATAMMLSELREMINDFDYS